MMLPPKIQPFLLSLVVVPMIVSCSAPSGGSDSQHTQVPPASKPADTQIETVLVVSKQLRRTVELPAELSSFREVAVYPKVQGYIKSIAVDRGSTVRQGQIMIVLLAPELEASYLEAQEKCETARACLSEIKAKIQSLIAQKEESQSKLESVEANYNRVKVAAGTVGAIAPADLETAEKAVQAARAHVRSVGSLVAAAQSEHQTAQGRVRIATQALKSVKEMKEYLTIRAPFDGIVSERNVHEGSLVSSSHGTALVRVQQISTLRLLVPVPESSAGGVRLGAAVNFKVSAYVGKQYQGKVARISHQVDRKTRTMIVEVDVDNTRQELQPGMYAEVTWEMARPYKTMFVPASSISSHDDRTFITVFRNDALENVEVSRGQSMGQFVEIVGAVKPGEEVALHGIHHRLPNVTYTRKLICQDDLERAAVRTVSHH